MWKPIETAPKDGTTILLFIRDYWGYEVSLAVTGFWGMSSDKTRYEWLSNCVDGYPILDPTSWHPLPELPPFKKES